MVKFVLDMLFRALKKKKGKVYLFLMKDETEMFLGEFIASYAEEKDNYDDISQ